MDLTTILPQNFKDLFYRDFPYLNVWDPAKTYNTGTKVYYSVTELFYTCKKDSVTSVPTTTTDWDAASDSIYNYILDADINKAFSEAQIIFNQSLFGSDANLTIAYLYLTAHFLVVDIRRSSQGLASKGDFLAQSQTVGAVSETLSIPSNMASNPIYQLYLTTGYGSKYLNLAMPALVGRVRIAYGATVA
jgi:hypothetical protein